jgi:hypothetical protein
MGGGSYSHSSRSVRSESLGYMDMSRGVQETFKQRSIHNQMSAVGVMRESRDSDEHPNSVPVIIGLDVTGSMGTIPRMFIADGLPTMMSGIFNAGIADPQLLIMAIGDHYKDNSALQVGQFESSDELIDKWLELIHVEGGGGGNDGESYSLAWAFGAYQTVLDSWIKRQQKGFIFTIGDEPIHPLVESAAMSRLTGNGDIDGGIHKLLEAARKTYHVYHLHVSETMTGRSPRVQGRIREIMGENMIIVDDFHHIPEIIARTVASVVSTYPAISSNTVAKAIDSTPKSTDTEEFL